MHRQPMRPPRSPRALTSRRIDRYILRQLVLALVAVTSGLVALIWLTQSLRFIELVVNRGLSLRVFAQLTGLLIPNFVAVILPITTFVVVQFVYQRLAGDRELTVMRAAGLSPMGLARPALVLAVMSVLAGYALNVWIVPASFGAFREFQFEIRNRVAAFLLQEGVFTPVSDDLTVYVRARDPDGTLRGIMVDDARNKSSHATILAETGRLMAGTGVPRVLLINGSRQELDHQTGRLNVLTFAENTVELTQDDKPGEQRFRDPTEMSIDELLHPAPGAVADRDIGKLRVEAHRRLSTPLTAVGFTLIALVSVLMGMFRRHGGLVRPFLAIMTVVALVALGLAVANLAARETSLIPLIWLHAIAPGVIAAWVLFGPQLRLMPVGLQAKLGVT
jgi:lipopolysaccharide export system permease protein